MITDSQYAAIVNLIPYQLTGIQDRPDAGFRENVSALVDATTKTPTLVSGASFNPDGAPFSTAMAALVSKCKANGTEVFAVSTTPGG